jgi:hypothetical protein
MEKAGTNLATPQATMHTSSSPPPEIEDWPRGCLGKERRGPRSCSTSERGGEPQDLPPRRQNVRKERMVCCGNSCLHRRNCGRRGIGGHRPKKAGGNGKKTEDERRERLGMGAALTTAVLTEGTRRKWSTIIGRSGGRSATGSRLPIGQKKVMRNH